MKIKIKFSLRKHKRIEIQFQAPQCSKVMPIKQKQTALELAQPF